MSIASTAKLLRFGAAHRVGGELFDVSEYAPHELTRRAWVVQRDVVRDGVEGEQQHLIMIEVGSFPSSREFDRCFGGVHHVPQANAIVSANTGHAQSWPVRVSVESSRFTEIQAGSARLAASPVGGLVAEHGGP